MYCSSTPALANDPTVLPSGQTDRASTVPVVIGGLEVDSDGWIGYTL
ncbi:MAG: hypothetical protein OXB98_11175 [Bryobacterales bacterium]|nr:hypothetical protein [Bryobacterales bacterium]